MSFNDIVSSVYSVVWGVPTVALFLFCGLLFAFRLCRFRCLRPAMVFGVLFGNEGKKSEKGGMSSRGALLSSLAATLGTGNIVGVATALSAGGPGAIFWMWVSAALGMFTHFAETVLAVRYRRSENGSFVGGPMYYMRDALGSRGMAALFSVCCLLASLGTGNLAQSNSLCEALNGAFGIPALAAAVPAALLVGAVMAGGVKRLEKVCSVLVPFMGAAYILAALVVIVCRSENLPAAISSIFMQAFGLKAVGGGAAGYAVSRAVSIGVSRGIFGNEAGMGSSAIVHAAAETADPVRQGIWGMAEVFADTMLLTTVSALALLCAFPSLPEMNGFALVSASFSSVLGDAGGFFTAVAVALFAFASILGWSYYGTGAARYLAGEKFVKLYKIMFSAIVCLGALSGTETAWYISDIFNALMAVPNLVAVILLSRSVEQCCALTDAAQKKQSAAQYSRYGGA